MEFKIKSEDGEFLKWWPYRENAGQIVEALPLTDEFPSGNGKLGQCSIAVKSATLLGMKRKSLPT